MNENFILYLWTFQLFQKELSTSNGQHIDVLSPGTRNQDSGPDFFNGKVKIGDTLWAGNIEIHVKASDWYRHQHHLDDAYNNIILHVVYENDRSVERKNGEPIPVLELKNKFDPQLLFQYEDFISTMHPIPCHQQIGRVNHFTMMNFMDALMIERLKDKTTSILHHLNTLHFDFNETFYQKLCRNFGFKTNTDAMELLAKSIPLSVISKHQDNLFQLEALFFGQAGFLSTPFEDKYPKQLLVEYQFLKEKYHLQSMDKKVWKFMRMRPANFPTIRIAQLAAVLSKTSNIFHAMLHANKLSHIIPLFEASASDYWNDHFISIKLPLPTAPRKSDKAQHIY